jgi:hypothetical protein
LKWANAVWGNDRVSGSSCLIEDLDSAILYLNPLDKLLSIPGRATGAAQYYRAAPSDCMGEV